MPEKRKKDFSVVLREPGQKKTSQKKKHGRVRKRDKRKATTQGLGTDQRSKLGKGTTDSTKKKN